MNFLRYFAYVLGANIQLANGFVDLDKSPYEAKCTHDDVLFKCPVFSERASICKVQTWLLWRSNSKIGFLHPFWWHSCFHSFSYVRRSSAGSRWRLGLLYFWKLRRGAIPSNFRCLRGTDLRQPFSRFFDTSFGRYRQLLSRVYTGIWPAVPQQCKGRRSTSTGARSFTSCFLATLTPQSISEGTCRPLISKSRLKSLCSVQKQE